MVISWNLAIAAWRDPAVHPHHTPLPNLWADGIHVNTRLEEHKLCLPAVIGIRAVAAKTSSC
jgi:hypothetical protein